MPRSRLAILQPGLAAFRSIEQDPKHHVIGEILEPVNFARGRKQEIPLFEGLAAGGADVFAAALNYYINFIPCMRLLGIDLLRRIDFNFQRAVSKDSGKCFTLGSRQMSKRLVYRHPALWASASLDGLRGWPVCSGVICHIAELDSFAGRINFC